MSLLGSNRYFGREERDLLFFEDRSSGITAAAGAASAATVLSGAMAFVLLGAFVHKFPILSMV